MKVQKTIQVGAISFMLSGCLGPQTEPEMVRNAVERTLNESFPPYGKGICEVGAVNPSVITRTCLRNLIKVMGKEPETASLEKCKNTVASECKEN